MKQKILSYIIVAGMLIFGVTANADDICSYEYFTDNIQKLSESLGTDDFAIPESEDPASEIIKQDAAGHLYELLIKADPQYIISPGQADEILNSCYDNAFIKEENKVAYASMIRHGIISTRTLTYPDKQLTEKSADILHNRILNLFSKKYPVSVGDKTIYIGSSVDEVYSKFGTPNRIDKSEYGFEWYVYNSYYSDFIMIGIKDDIVCAYFTNAQNFEYNGIRPGDTEFSVPGREEPQIFKDNNGAVDGVWYNPHAVIAEYNEELQYNQLLDMINANRVRNGLLTLFPDKPVKIPTTVTENTGKVTATSCANNALEAYLGLFLSDKGAELLSYSFSGSSVLVSELEYAEPKKNWTISLINNDMMSTALPKLRDVDTNTDSAPVRRISKPEIISPEMNEYIKDGNVEIVLKKRSAGKYLVTVYNAEQDANAVYAYITTNSHKITIPSYMLTKGNVYRVTVASVSEDKVIDGNTVEFIYGECENPISLTMPVHGLSTYDDEIEIMASSPAYRKFRIDVYNDKNKIVLTKELEDSGNCILQTLAPGKYHICVTAVSRATGKDMGNSFATVEIKPFTPEIREFILEEGEVFEYYYGDGTKWLYFYDTEIIAVTENQIIPVPDKDMIDESVAETVVEGTEENIPEAETNTPESESNTAEAEVNTEVNITEQLEEVTVYKTKITQRKVPATKRYRALAGLIPQYTQTTGAFMERDSGVTPTETGNAVAAMALSYQGVPYVWGGTSPSGFDCSGLVKYICNSLGIKNVARTSAQQFASSGSFVEKKDLIPGDLVFFQKNGTIHHVGIYIGNDMMVHAPHTGDVVKISSLSESYYKREYAGAKRVA